LAAIHQSSTDDTKDELKLLDDSIDINIKGLGHFLEAMSVHSNKSKLFYAASSHLFGKVNQHPQNELTAFNPICVYGISKLAGVNLCKYYRDQHGIFASAGILYNHESPRRAEQFVSRKIIKTAVRIKNGSMDKLSLGDLNTQVDWGYAKDYISAFHKLLQINFSDNFIIGSGKTHTIKDFVVETFDQLDLNWEDHVTINKNQIKKVDRGLLVSDITKIITKADWKPATNFSTLVKIMVDSELANSNG
jgi:GDPmannose 4,6-dehydratase